MANGKPQAKIPTLDDVVQAYIECGSKIGFLSAEFILMKHLPEDNPTGYCYNVPESKRAEFVKALKEAIE